MCRYSQSYVLPMRDGHPDPDWTPDSTRSLACGASNPTAEKVWNPGRQPIEMKLKKIGRPAADIGYADGSVG